MALAHGRLFFGDMLNFGAVGSQTNSFIECGEEFSVLIEPLLERDVPIPSKSDWLVRRQHGLSVAKGTFGTLFSSHCGGRALIDPPRSLVENQESRAIRIYQPKGVDAESFQRTCLNVFLPQTLALFGSTLLHAACVRVGDGVVLFAGESGLGKSTLAAGFATRGFDVFSDDVIRVEAQASSATAYRAYAGGHLRAGSFLLPHTTASPTYTEPKHWFDFGSEHGDVPAAPVLAFYFLGRSRRTKVEIQALRPASAVHMILRSLFLDGFDRQQRSREALGRATKLASAMPVYSLNYRRDSRRFDALMDAILEHAAGL